MTTLYRPVLIETAEQAEALPGGSIVLDHERKWVYTDYFIAARPPLSGLQDDLDHGVHVVALVPVEAEEETRVTPEALVIAATQVLPRAEEAARIYAIPPGMLMIQQQARLVTPWEHA